jgi:GNAT superfamily N-acetyltransferase
VALLADFIVRRGKPEDMAYVFSSWLKTSRKEQPEVRTDDFMSGQHRRVAWLVQTSGVLSVVHPVAAPDVICAWALLDAAPSVAHYVFVRQEYRGRGLARFLLEGRGICTHLTAEGQGLKRKLAMRYMPHLLDGGWEHEPRSVLRGDTPPAAG